MARRHSWRDEYWLLLIRLYLQQPVGVKRLYSRGLVSVAMELHFSPHTIHRRMYSLRHIDTPRLQKLWNEYADNPRKLARGIKLLRQMNGFGNAEAFYAGVETDVTWEKDFKPFVATTPPASGQVHSGTGGGAPMFADEGRDPLTPAKLIMMLDLYFRLTPITMVPETPEVQELARLLRSTPQEVTEAMDAFLALDPYVKPGYAKPSPLLEPCRQVWKRFGNDDPDKLAALAAQLKDYFAQ